MDALAVDGDDGRVAELLDSRDGVVQGRDVLHAHAVAARQSEHLRDRPCCREQIQNDSRKRINPERLVTTEAELISSRPDGLPYLMPRPGAWLLACHCSCQFSSFHLPCICLPQFSRQPGRCHDCCPHLQVQVVYF